MSNKRSGRKNRCPKCHINNSVCFCNQLIPIETRTRISILMHVAEINFTSNTAMIGHYLLSNSDLLLRGKINHKIDYSFLNNDQYEFLYLYPDEGAVDLTPEYLATLKKPVHLIVPDGSWSQATKIKRREKLDQIQSVKIPFSMKSEYKLRTAHFPEALCTLEALAYAMGIIENSETQEYLLNKFRLMNDLHAKARNLENLRS